MCLSVTLILTSRVFVRLTKDTTYLTGNEGQKFRTVFSANVQLQSWSASSIVYTAHAGSRAAENAHALIFITGLPRPGPLALCILKTQEVTTKGVY